MYIGYMLHTKTEKKTKSHYKLLNVDATHKTFYRKAMHKKSKLGETAAFSYVTMIPILQSQSKIPLPRRWT